MCACGAPGMAGSATLPWSPEAKEAKGFFSEPLEPLDYSPTQNSDGDIYIYNTNIILNYIILYYILFYHIYIY